MSLGYRHTVLPLVDWICVSLAVAGAATYQAIVAQPVDGPVDSDIYVVRRGKAVATTLVIQILQLVHPSVCPIALPQNIIVILPTSHDGSVDASSLATGALLDVFLLASSPKPSGLNGKLRLCVVQELSNTASTIPRLATTRHPSWSACVSGPSEKL